MFSRLNRRLVLLCVALGLALAFILLSSGLPQIAAQGPTATSSPVGGGIPINIPSRGFSGVLLPGGGLRITQVQPGGLAEQSRLRVEDVIISVTGILVDQSTINTALERLNAPGRTATLIVRRGATVVTILLRATPLVSVTPRPTATPRVPTPVAGITTRIQLGVAFEVITEATARQRNLTVTYGALVTSVLPGSPADVAGIRQGDIILEVEGDRVDPKRSLTYRMQPYVAGDTVTLHLLRGAEEIDIKVTLVVLRGVA